MTAEPMPERRGRMVRDQLVARGIRDERVLAAMAKIPRECFLPPGKEGLAYTDGPVGIGFGQTISQPYIVARMSELLEIRPGDRVLEIGSGCGYQTAVLLELGAEISCIEIVPELASSMETRLRGLGYTDFRVACRDGRGGDPDHDPYDAILIAAAADEIPPALIGQLAPGGRLTAPVREAGGEQMLRFLRRSGDRIIAESVFPVQFVPLVGSSPAS